MPLENVLPGMPTPTDTLLTISGMGEMLYQARGLTQTLDLIVATKQQKRTINATLVDISNPVFRKYATTITCGKDTDAPPLDHVWPGMIVTVECAVSLAYENGNPGSPERPAASGSSYTSGNYTFYRPIFTMMVTSKKQTFDEWQCANGWELQLEEM